MRVLLVTGAMGGGHLAVARELAHRLRHRGHEVDVADLHELMPRPVARWLEALYPWLVSRAPRLYDLVYRRFFLAPQWAGERAGPPVRLAVPGLRRRVMRFAPDVVVSNYHLAALAVGRVREEGTLRAPAIAFITTFGVHELWLHPATDVTVCISRDAAREVEQRTGRPARVAAPAVREGFRGDTTHHRTELRRSWGVAPGQAVALVVAGALGMGSIVDTVTAVAATANWVPVVVCGRNPQLRRRVAALGLGRVLGWVEDMPAVTGAADVLVDNAAGLTAKEALAAGVPVLTVDPIAGHGRADAEAMARLGLTEVVDSPADLPGALARVAPGSAERERRTARGRELMRGDVADVIEEVGRKGG